MHYSRRRFLKDSIFISATSTFLTRPAIAKSTSPSTYDHIIVGAGPSGIIVAKKLVDQGYKVLLLEAGSPTAACVGGKDFPPYISDHSKTIFDIPGEYGDIAFKAKGRKYQLKEAPWTYQGMGFGGNSQFNGMLFQMAPEQDFQENWPEDWSYGELQAYLHKTISKMKVTDLPSNDHKHYFKGLFEYTGSVYQDHNFRLENTSILGQIGERYYSRPYVVAKNGSRSGPVQTHLCSIVGKDGYSTHPRFTILKQCKVDKIIFDADQNDKAIGVSFLQRDSISDQTNDQFNSLRELALLKPNGRIILAAGALMTPRLLYLSGVGPKDRHHEIFSDRPTTFHIDNKFIGTELSDHIGSSLVFEAPEGVDFHSINYEDYRSNQSELDQYRESSSGPYAQYGPISVAHICDREQQGRANVEYFINPAGLGPEGGQFFGSQDFSVHTMLLRPKAKTLLRLDTNHNVRYPSLYLTEKEDMTLMARSVKDVIAMMKAKGAKLKFGPGGLSHPHLSGESLSDVTKYLSSWEPYVLPEGNRIYYTRLIMNHWAGTCSLGKAVEPEDLRVKGTDNIHVVDASIIPKQLSAHPVATVMVMAEKAGELISQIQ